MNVTFTFPHADDEWAQIKWRLTVCSTRVLVDEMVFIGQAKPVSPDLPDIDWQDVFGWAYVLSSEQLVLLRKAFYDALAAESETESHE